MARGADFACFIDVQRIHIQIPVVIAHGTSGIGRIPERELFFVDEIHPRGVSAPRAIHQLVYRLDQLAAVVVEFEP